jgi:holliday junction DNA helicase RuvB
MLVTDTDLETIAQPHFCPNPCFFYLLLPLANCLFLSRYVNVQAARAGRKTFKFGLESKLCNSLTLLIGIAREIDFLLEFLMTPEKHPSRKFMAEPFIQSSWTKPDEPFEMPLRPQSLPDFVGQDNIRERLEVFMQAAKQRGEALGHCLLNGPPGLGKTTLAHIIAKTMGTNLTVTSGPVIEKPGDLAGILTNLNEGDVLFIDEIHRMNRSVEEYLYPAMEDFSLDLLIDSGPSARSVQVKLKPFTLVGATTRSGLLSSPMRSRFGLQLRLDYYPASYLERILERSGQILGVKLAGEGALSIAERARGTPRIANNLLRWVRDFAQIKGHPVIDREIAHKALNMLEIDDRGLDEMDKKILSLIIDHYQGGPVGINTLAVALSEEAHTLEEVYEPYLIMQGFIKRTPRGREVTHLSYEHLGRRPPAKFKNGEDV